MSAFRHPSGDRPSLPHRAPRNLHERQTRLKLRTFSEPQKPKYADASEWPDWTDESVYTAFVEPDEWPNDVARIRFTVPMTLETWPTTPQDATEPEQGGAAS